MINDMGGRVQQLRHAKSFGGTVVFLFHLERRRGGLIFILELVFESLNLLLKSRWIQG